MYYLGRQRPDPISSQDSLQPTKLLAHRFSRHQDGGGTGIEADTLWSAQVRQLMDTCGADIVGRRDRVVLSVLVGAGLRRAELAGL